MIRVAQNIEEACVRLNWFYIPTPSLRGRPQISSLGRVEVVVYTSSEIDYMFETFHPTLLEALDHGVALYDAGKWGELRGKFDDLRRRGVIQRSPIEWKIAEEA
ncbi:MAG: hypothetical protein ACUVXI_01530 [bacterium]